MSEQPASSRRPDKLSAMMASSNASQQQQGQTSTNSSPSAGGKLSAMMMAQANHNNNNNNNNSLAPASATLEQESQAPSATIATPTNDSPTVPVDREQIWNDLDRAEATIIQLLETTYRTTQKLSNPSTALDINTDEYSNLVQQLHDSLSPHASFVKAYKNSKNSTNQPFLEESIAQEKEEVLKEWLKIETEGL